MRRKSLLVLFIVLSMALFSLGGCGQSEPKTEVATDFPNNSIVKYLPEDEGCQKLIADMQDGRIPTSCDVLYDEMGGRASVVTEDTSTITELYNLFVQITVGEQTDESITDSYHHVIFTLQDGRKVAFYFESDIWCYGSGIEDRVKVNSSGPFWKKVREMQDGKLFLGDIYSNIVITAPELTLDQAWEAAEIASIAYDELIAKNGFFAKLVERQRLEYKYCY